jgi:ferredoxin
MSRAGRIWKTRCASAVGWTAALLLAAPAWAQERFPPPDFRSGYRFPQSQVVLPHGAWRNWLDAGLFAACLGLAAWLAVKKRSRTGLFWLTVFSVAYFGFYREGCVCAVGSLQNVAAATFGTNVGLPWIVGVFFALPLIAALFYGRVFCSSVCPLGAVQDLVLFKPLQVPGWLEAGLGLLAHLYLAAAVVFAAVGSEFLICSYDPFVGFFRRSASLGMILLGAGLLLASMFVGRTYCRFLCPYSVLLRTFSTLAKWPVHVSPTACISCKLCQESCPLGALNTPRPGIDASDRFRRMLAAAVLGAAAITLGAIGGYQGRALWSRLDNTVQLAQAVQASEKGSPPVDFADQLTAWHKTGESPQDLYVRAGKITASLGRGAAVAGAWLGCVIAFRLLKWGRGLPRAIYDADAGTCLACARCFADCPVELERLGMIPSATAVALPVLQGVGR